MLTSVPVGTNIHGRTGLGQVKSYSHRGKTGESALQCEWLIALFITKLEQQTTYIKRQFALRLVQDRLKSPTDATDMLNLFLDLHKSSPGKFTVRDVIAAAYINVSVVVIFLLPTPNSVALSNL